MLPVGRYSLGWPRNRLPFRVTCRWSERRPQDPRAGPPVVEPLFARLEALDDRVASQLEMCSSVPVEGIVTASDVPASGTPSEVEPPAAGLFTFEASRSRRRDSRIDLGVHGVLPFCFRRFDAPR